MKYSNNTEWIKQSSYDSSVLVVDHVTNKCLVFDNAVKASMHTNVDVRSITSALDESEINPGKYMIAGWSFILVKDFLKNPVTKDKQTTSEAAAASRHQYHANLAIDLVGPEVSVMNIYDGVITKFANLRKAIDYYCDRFYEVLKWQISKDVNEFSDNKLYCYNSRIYKFENDKREWWNHIDTRLEVKNDKVDVPWVEDTSKSIKKSIKLPTELIVKDYKNGKVYYIQSMTELLNILGIVSATFTNDFSDLIINGGLINGCLIRIAGDLSPWPEFTKEEIESSHLKFFSTDKTPKTFDPYEYYEKTKLKKFKDSSKLEGINIEIKDTKNNSPFVSKGAEYDYYLTKLDGRQRCDALGITDALYGDSDMASIWYKEICDILMNDKEVHKEAFEELDKIYEIMIANDDYDDKVPF